MVGAEVQNIFGKACGPGGNFVYMQKLASFGAGAVRKTGALIVAIGTVSTTVAMNGARFGKLGPNGDRENAMSPGWQLHSLNIAKSRI